MISMRKGGNKRKILCVIAAFMIYAFAGMAAAANYYVSPSGADTNAGTSTAAPFKTIQKAANIVNPGDTVYVMNGTYTNACATCDVVSVTRSGSLNAWITFTAYPGHTTKIRFNGWNGFKFSGSASYIEVSGLEIEGNNSSVTLEEAKSQPTSSSDPRFNGGGIGIDGRKSGASKPHYFRFINNKVYNCGGGGIGCIHTDYVTVSNNAKPI